MPKRSDLAAIQLANAVGAAPQNTMDGQTAQGVTAALIYAAQGSCKCTACKKLRRAATALMAENEDEEDEDA